MLQSTPLKKKIVLEIQNIFIPPQGRLFKVTSNSILYLFSDQLHSIPLNKNFPLLGVTG
jgi:hypothetical protein